MRRNNEKSSTLNEEMKKKLVLNFKKKFKKIERKKFDNFLYGNFFGYFFI